MNPFHVKEGGERLIILFSQTHCFHWDCSILLLVEYLNQEQYIALLINSSHHNCYAITSGVLA